MPGAEHLCRADHKHNLLILNGKACGVLGHVYELRPASTHESSCVHDLECLLTSKASTSLLPRHALLWDEPQALHHYTQPPSEALCTAYQYALVSFSRVAAFSAISLLKPYSVPNRTATGLRPGGGCSSPLLISSGTATSASSLVWPSVCFSAALHELDRCHEVELPSVWYRRQQGGRERVPVHAKQIASLDASQNTTPSNPGISLPVVSNQKRLLTGTGMKRTWRMPEER